MSGGPMNLDINVDEHDWKTISVTNSKLYTNIRSNATKTTTHPLASITNKTTTATTTAATTTKQVEKKADVVKKAPISLDVDPLRAMLEDPLSAISTFQQPEDKVEEKGPEIHPQLGDVTNQPQPDEVESTTSSQSNDPTASNDLYNTITSKLQRRFEFWNEKVPRILEKYTTSTSIAVDNNFLNDNAAASGEQSQGQQQPDTQGGGKQQKDQAAQRLEEIENEASTSKAAKSYLSQKDFVKHIEEQHTKLLAAWEKGERVVALRIVIKCAEMLANMAIPQFYPSMYVILTRILDTFGDLVFNRIRERGIQSIDSITKQIIYQPLSATFRASDVCSSAKETCKNWFFKTICIRELLPRLYIDLSLIKCYRFLEDDTFAANLQRVCAQIRGVGDPLTAAYLRSYIATKALDISYSFHEVLPPPSQRYFVAPAYRQAVQNALNDWLVQHRYLKQTQCANVPIVKQGDITPQQYFSLMAPAIEWIVQVLHYNEDSDEVFAKLLKENITDHDDLILLHGLLNAFKPEFIQKHLKGILGVVHGMLDDLREKWHKYDDIIQEEIQPSESEDESDESDDDDSDDESDESDSDESDSDDDGKKKKKKKAKKVVKKEKKPKKEKKQKKEKVPKVSHTQKSADYQTFLSLHKYVEEYATLIFATICKKLIMYTHGSAANKANNTLTMTSSLLNALWSGICDCPYKEFVNQHSPSLALLICVHGRWTDTAVLLKTALSTVQSKRFTMSLSTLTDNISDDMQEEVIEYQNTMRTIENIFALTPHLMALLSSDYILSILDQLQRPQRVQMSTILLQRYKQYVLAIQDKNKNALANVSTTAPNQPELPSTWKTNDSVLIHTLHELCHHVHTNISALSSKTETDQIADLCQYVILSIDFGVDVETQLSTYVSFRSSLSELPQTLALLVYQVNKLAMRALQFVNEKKNPNGTINTTINPSSHNRKTAGFVKAAIAFCHITIPSLPHTTNSHIFYRIMLFLTSAQTSIANNLLPQAEALITAAIQQLSLLSTDVKTSEGSNMVKHMSVHDMSLQVTSTIQTILATITMLPPVGGQWLRLLGILLNLMEKDTCPLIDLIATPVIYVNSLYVVSAMTHDNKGNPTDGNISQEEKSAIANATKTILTKLIFAVKVIYSVGGGSVTGLTKDENTEITKIVSQQTVKYPPQLICDTLTNVTHAFFHVMKLDAYTATIIYSIITGVREILKSHPYSTRTMEHFVQYAKDKSDDLVAQQNNPKELKMYRDLAKKLVQFMGK